MLSIQKGLPFELPPITNLFYSYCPQIDFLVWLLCIDGMRVFPFDKHLYLENGSKLSLQTKEAIILEDTIGLKKAIGKEGWLNAFHCVINGRKNVPQGFQCKENKICNFSDPPYISCLSDFQVANLWSKFLPFARASRLDFFNRKKVITRIIIDDETAENKEDLSEEFNNFVKDYTQGNKERNLAQQLVLHGVKKIYYTNYISPVFYRYGDSIVLAIPLKTFEWQDVISLIEKAITNFDLL
jgi:hypothetical protein